jgi:hypothetical protein
MEGTLAAIAGFMDASSFNRGFSEGNLSRMALTIERMVETPSDSDPGNGWGQGGWGYDVSSHVILIGRHMQRAHAGHVRTALTVGLDTGFWLRRQRYQGWRDRFAVLNLPGLGVEGFWGGPAWGLTGFVQTHVDFVSVDTPHREAWRARYPDERGKTIVRKQGYAYGWGPSLMTGIQLRLGLAEGHHVSLGGSLVLARYTSMDGLDRSQEDVTRDARVVESLHEVNLFARGTLRNGLFAQFEWSRLDRSSTLDVLVARRDVQRLSLAAGLVF